MVENNNDTQTSHIGFSDESYTQQGNWLSVGLVTMRSANMNELEREFTSLYKKLDVKSEIKWNKTTLNTDNERQICEFVIEKAKKRQLRVDVIVVHKTNEKTKIEFLSKMYYVLFKNVLWNRWSDTSVWTLYPDEHPLVDWNDIKCFLKNTNLSWLKTADGIEFCKKFEIVDIVPTNSKCNVFLQIADIFSGLSVFSRASFEEYRKWPKDNTQLFDFEDDKITKTARLELLHAIYKCCGRNKLYVSLNRSQGLYTYRPSQPINFWELGKNTIK